MSITIHDIDSILILGLLPYRLRRTPLFLRSLLHIKSTRIHLLILKLFTYISFLVLLVSVSPHLYFR